MMFMNNEIFQVDLKLFEERLEPVTEEILQFYVDFMGIEVPPAFSVPPIEFSDAEKVLQLGVRPSYNLLLRKIGRLKTVLANGGMSDIRYQNSFDLLNQIKSFIENCQDDFADKDFDEIDKLWLQLKQEIIASKSKDAQLEQFVNELKIIMVALYYRPYTFVVSGDYSHEKHKIWLYVNNIEKRLKQEPDLAFIPVQQLLECMLAHELFHCLHFMSLEEACLAADTTLVKQLNPVGQTGVRRSQSLQKRKTVLESLAKYFECSFAKAKGYHAYVAHEKLGFRGRRRHYPAWPYAGAKGLLEGEHKAAFLQAFMASVNIKQGRGFVEAYGIIDKVNEL